MVLMNKKDFMKGNSVHASLNYGCYLNSRGRTYINAQLDSQY